MRRVLLVLAAATLAACNVYGDKSGCDYGGKHRKVGDIFPALDGCNTCQCMDTGVSCTLIACVPDAGPMACAPSGACGAGPACGSGCCAQGEHCSAGTCMCGALSACGPGDTCAAFGPVGGDACGSTCCGASGPCPQ